MYIKLINSVPKEYPIGQLYRDNPQTSFPKTIPDTLLAEYAIFPLTILPLPEYDSETQQISLTDPELVGGDWTQRYSVIALTAEELEEKRLASIPRSVSMAQARSSLISGGYMPAITTALAAMTGIEGEVARSNWEYAATVDRNDSLTHTLATALGLTARQVDTLFIAAAAL